MTSQIEGILERVINVYMVKVMKCVTFSIGLSYERINAFTQAKDETYFVIFYLLNEQKCVGYLGAILSICMMCSSDLTYFHGCIVLVLCGNKYVDYEV